MKQKNTLSATEIHADDMANNTAYREAYHALEGEFSMVNALIQARTHAHLSQTEVARLMGTTESVVSRLESGRTMPSTRTLERYARATGHMLHIHFEPISAAP